MGAVRLYLVVFKGSEGISNSYVGPPSTLH